MMPSACRSTPDAAACATRAPSRTRPRWFAAALASLLATLVALTPASASTFDHSYADWDTTLRRHVRWDAKGVASSVDYKAIAAERAALRKVLDGFSAVTEAEFGGWNRNQRLAFLVNAYNAFTLELILTKYPDLRSIRDLGSIFQSAWKKTFFRLFGAQRNLDYIEHDLIRAPGAFDDPRVHVVLVCASVGCPALRPEAIVAERLDAQLDDSMRRFLSDRSRNRYDPVARRLEVSKIFEWYKEDFEKGHRGIASRETLFARYADQLADAADDRRAVREGMVVITVLSYDWALNDRR